MSENSSSSDSSSPTKDSSNGPQNGIPSQKSEPTTIKQTKTSETPKDESGRLMKKDDSIRFDINVSAARKKGAHRLTSLLPFYWASLLLEEQIANVLPQLGDCILIDAPPKITKKGGELARFSLCMKTATGVEKINVKCAANDVLVESNPPKLVKWILHRRLRPIPRKVVWEAKELAPLETPLNAGLAPLFEMGKVAHKKLQMEKQSIPIVSITINDLSADERQIVLQDIRKMVDFGNSAVLRLWGSVVTNADISLLVEDVSIGPLTDVIRNVDREKLLDYSLQICSAVSYFEMVDFVHKKLSTDVCLLTSKQVVKVAVFGLSTGVIPKRFYLEETDRCRWVPWECLLPDAKEYDHKGMVWTFGTMVWSIYHGGVLPFENETAAQIRTKMFRKTAVLPSCPELLPQRISEVISKCWQDAETRPSMCSIQALLNKNQD